MHADIFSDTRWESFSIFCEAYMRMTALVNEAIRNSSGLPTGLADLVCQLAMTPGHTLKMSDLALSLSTSPPRTTRLVDDAQRRALVLRLPYPEDRRATLVQLTDEGLEAASIAGHATLAAVQKHMYEVLDDATVIEFTSALRRLRDAARCRAPRENT